VHHVKLASALTHGNSRDKREGRCSGRYMSSGKPPCHPHPLLACSAPSCTWTLSLALLHLPAIPASGCLKVQLAQALTHMPRPAAEWGPVCDRYDPPLPTISGLKGSSYPEGRYKAVFKEIQKLPQVICVICNPPASAVPNCTPTPPALLSAYPGQGAGRAFETATTRSPPPGCAAKCEAPHLADAALCEDALAGRRWSIHKMFARTCLYIGI